MVLVKLFPEFQVLFTDDFIDELLEDFAELSTLDEVTFHKT